MHINDQLLFYVKPVLLVIFALSAQHWKSSLWNSHEDPMLCIQPALHHDCLALRCVLIQPSSSLLGTHVG